MMPKKKGKSVNSGPITSEPSISKGTRAKKASRPVRVIDEYMNTQTMRKVPVTEYALELLASRMIEYYKANTKALFLNEFLWEEGIDSKTFWRFLKRSQALSEAHSMVKDMLAHRCLTFGITKQNDSGLTRYTMPLYGEEWREHAKFISSLNKNDQSEKEGQKKVIVQIENLTSSDKD